MPCAPLFEKLYTNSHIIRKYAYAHTKIGISYIFPQNGAERDFLVAIIPDGWLMPYGIHLAPRTVRSFSATSVPAAFSVACREPICGLEWQKNMANDTCGHAQLYTCVWRHYLLYTKISAADPLEHLGTPLRPDLNMLRHIIFARACVCASVRISMAACLQPRTHMQPEMKMG